MAKYNLNMSVNHCPNWGFWEAIREILQNGDDEQQQNPENTFEVVYQPEKEKLILKNKKSILEKESLLIGYSTKRDDKETTGKYGEGYKVSLAVLSRLGKRVVIKNYHNKEKWAVIVENETVKVDINKFIFKSVPDNNLTWEISNVTQKEWDSIQKSYLPFIENLQIVKTKYGALIKNKELVGNIYVNNLFIENVKNLDYAYSFPSSLIELDRDRKAVKMFDLQFSIGLILSMVNGENKDTVNIFEILKGESKEAEYLHATLGDDSVENIKHNFVKEHSDRSYPVSTQEDYDLISNQFKQLKPVFVKEQLKKVMIKNKEYESPIELMDSLGLENKEHSENTPHDILLKFYLKNKEKISFSVEEELVKVLELSKEWEQKESGLDEVEQDSEYSPDDMSKQESVIVESARTNAAKVHARDVILSSRGGYDFDDNDDIPI